jgi:hypothetical protein
MEEYPESFDIGDRLPCVASEIISRGSKRNLKNCSSSSGLALFEAEDDHGEPFYTGFCFSCNQNFYKEELPGTSAGDHVGLDGEGRVTERKTFTKPPKQPPMNARKVKAFMATKTYNTGHYRGIMDKYSKFFGHVADVDSNGEVMARYYPETVEGKVRGFKCRNHPKDFRYGKVGVTGVQCELSGQIKFNSGGKYLLIVGGEEDKAAAYQMLAESQKTREKYKGQEKFSPIPVVSPTAGEGSAAKQVKMQYDWCDTYDIIIIGMDNDEAGRNAARAVAEVLPKEKVKIATWTGKDPNKMLQLGMTGQFVRDFYGAKDYLVDTVKTSIVADAEMEEELSRPKIPLPGFMKELSHIMAGGIPLGYWINLGAQTGGGKTTFINEMIYYWVFNSPHKIGILSLELNAGQYQTVLLSRHIGQKIQLIEDPDEAVKFVQQDWVQEKRLELRENAYGEQRYTLLDDRDGSLDNVQLQIEKLIKKYECKLVVIDPINDLFEGVSLEQQTSFVKYLKGVIKGGISLFCVCHITKGKTQVDKDGNRVLRQLTEDDFAGVSNIIKSGGCNILTSRDKLAEDLVERNTTNVEVPKCRWTGRSGPAGKWLYDNDKHTMYDYDTYFSQ